MQILKAESKERINVKKDRDIPESQVRICPTCYQDLSHRSLVTDPPVCEHLLGGGTADQWEKEELSEVNDNGATGYSLRKNETRPLQ